MINLHQVSKIYQVGDQPVYALADITEHIKTGEYVAIMGPSGSGKSTLLNLLGCLLRPTEGSYQLNGEDINTLSDAELSKLRQSLIGFIFQSFHLIPRLTAAGNVELPMIFAGIAPQERQQRVATALEAVGLTPRSHHRPDQLSVGQRQRVVIARATVMNPQLILADEPTGNLDRESGKQILGLLDRLYSLGHTLIVVTHDIDVANRAERVLVISDGHIVQRTSSNNIKNRTSVTAPSSS
ncbi:MAG: macrolide ABC transporter ATP-binding protein [Nitrospirales bacterium]|nr:MAG: macrolide ABC transporter ATP-binding protein [Nitrospirales bacterium]